ncbi:MULTISPECIES: transcription termination factor Rho [Carnobacterium]|jgi:transcription termination factor Rho|uniref:Transcription termination factor Rho n=2 Tax=Carnobacterium TaxID=2747 RepID=A0AAW9JQD7_CARML|nr:MULTISPECIES: transcription termination factor Rho [Carnobacterium]AOA02866.1 transcription termination factor Rho [Carnobacterium maltaromaticum]KRN71931.1 transcription termination factor Rho [Carnobacterium maltaromaticum]KRN86070.1 transcription termination factor Rho [Carnobacterium maltaromaticum]MBC9789090.1 transcription termination factor Rho [Carnobacterium maltaromaticum]MBC9810021.1 transcription termination factor Rho [Carnobacterium maltaromaticum]
MGDLLTLAELEKKTLKELYTFAKDFKIPYYSQMNKKELSLAVLRAQEEKQGFFVAEGVLDIVSQEGFGFLRPINYTPSQEDIYISVSQIRRFGLRNGDKITGKARPPKPSERYYGLMHVNAVNGKNPEEAKERSHFPALTALYPERQMKLETEQVKISNRMIDILAPVGFGQRGLIVAPPKAGKTILLKEIANGITKNYPDAELIILLIDERPEEVTDIERSVKGDVVSSTFDQQPENHVRVTELVLERAMRLVEDKRDVIILMDSITRLARAYNLVVPPSGRTLSGGIDPAAFYRPKRFFGAARNIEEGGSLTILATALVDTGSRMDDIIYEEFKGTGNSELHLSRELSERRIFPAIDIKKSSTRKEELLMPGERLEEIWKLRRLMTGDSLEFTDKFIKILRKTKTNADFFASFSEEAFGKGRTNRTIRK